LADLKEVYISSNMGDMGDMGELGDLGNTGDMGDIGDMGDVAENNATVSKLVVKVVSTFT